MEELNVWLIGGGLAVGAVLGVLIQRFRFCMVAGTSNIMLMQDYRQAFMFVTAWIAAISGTYYLEANDIVAIGDSSYRNSLLDWFGAIFGGVIFGVGAALAGGCAGRTLIKTMEGSLHALLALLSFCIVGAVTQFGFLESARLGLTGATAVELKTDAGLAAILSLPGWLPVLVVLLLMVAFLFYSWRRGGSLPLLITGVIVGGLVVASWYITGVLAQDDFDPVKPSAITMSGPMARFGYIIISGRIPELSFTIAFVLGTAAAGFLSAVVTGQFKITPVTRGMALYALIGGSLMGVGGVIAYGCNIGQGLSGVSTLSLESLLAVAGMLVGTVLGVKWWELRSG